MIKTGQSSPLRSWSGPVSVLHFRLKMIKIAGKWFSVNLMNDWQVVAALLVQVRRQYGRVSIENFNCICRKIFPWYLCLCVAGWYWKGVWIHMCMNVYVAARVCYSSISSYLVSTASALLQTRTNTQIQTNPNPCLIHPELGKSWNQRNVAKSSTLADRKHSWSISLFHRENTLI